jgi:hypothetical protein
VAQNAPADLAQLLSKREVNPKPGAVTKGSKTFLRRVPFLGGRFIERGEPRRASEPGVVVFRLA